MVLTVLYSIAGLGIAIVNDFKSIEGDRCRFQYVVSSGPIVILLGVSESFYFRSKESLDLRALRWKRRECNKT